MKGITHRSTLLGRYSHDTMWSVYAVKLQLNPAAEHREVLNLNTRVAALVSGYTYMCVCVML